MTIPTPTNSPAAPPDAQSFQPPTAFGIPDAGAGALPQLDLGLLQRMATEFFQAAPGGHSDPGASHRPSPGVSYPSAPASNVTPAGSVLLAQGAPTTPPSSYAPVSAPRESAATSGLAQNVPEAYAAALPVVSAPSPGGSGPSSAGSSPAAGGASGLYGQSAPGAGASPFSAPWETSALSAPVPGVPVGYAPALPSVSAPASPRPAQPASGVPEQGTTAATGDHAPYYFLTKPSDPSGDAFLNGLARQGLGLDQVTVQPFAMPGQDGLVKLIPSEGRQQAAPGGSPAPSIEPRFGFLESAALAPNTSQLPVSPATAGLLDVHAVRKDFPILSERVNGKPLIWFDNAATTQKPQAVIDRLAHFYAHENSNIHRAAHELAARATDAYESARQKVADYIGAKSPGEIIFVRGATEAINLVARTYGRQEIGEGDEIIVSHLEHHANIVPWQMLAENKRARLRVIPVDDSGQIRLDEYRKLLGPRTKLVAVTQVSNALGTVTPIAEITAMAHAAGAKVLVDGAQSVSHMRVNVQALDADFFVFSGHKVFAPTGIGVVYGKRELLERMPPWQGGGNMIADVTFEQTIYNPPPGRFEAGTGNIADAVGLGAALDYVQKIGLERISQYEHFLLEYATHRLQVIPGVRLVGTAREKASVLSFVLDGYKTEEVGEALNHEGIAVRSGHHCAQPILRRFGLEATVRPSLAFYNTCEEVDVFIKVISGLSRKRKG